MHREVGVIMNMKPIKPVVIAIVFFLLVLNGPTGVCAGSDAPALVSRVSAQVLTARGIPLLCRLPEGLVVSLSAEQRASLPDEAKCLWLPGGRKEGLYVLEFPAGMPAELARQTDALVLADNRLILAVTESEAEYWSARGAELRKLFLEQKPAGVNAADLPQSVPYNMVVAQTIAQIETAYLMQHISWLSGQEPVTVDGAAYTIVTRHSRKPEEIAKATQYAYAFFTSLGYSTEFFYFDGPGDRNVIALKPGTSLPDQYVVLCAHIDDMPWGDVAPGADDNATGCVSVMAAAELLVALPLERSVIFALWTGEEQGLHGSHHYAAYAASSGMDIAAVINLDMVGWDGVNGPDFALHAATAQLPGSRDLAEVFADAVTTYGLDLAPQILDQGTDRSDHASFWDYGYSAILGIETYDDFNPYYHTIYDRMEYINTTYFTAAAKASLAALMHTAGVSDVLQGDIDGSGRVDGLDLILLGMAFGASQGEGRYNPGADLDRSLTVDGQDLAILAAYFGRM